MPNHEVLADVLRPCPTARHAILSRLKHAIETGINAKRRPTTSRTTTVTFGARRATVCKCWTSRTNEIGDARWAGGGTFVNYLGPEKRRMTSPRWSARFSSLKRFATEPYMTRLATIHATSADLRGSCALHLAQARCSRNPLIVRMYRQVNMVRLHAQ
jgi:hypothetical protein